MSTEVASRSSSGGELRIRAAKFPARKTLEEFDFSFARSLKKAAVLHLAQLDFLHARESVVLLGPPGTGKTHLAIAGSPSRRPPNGWRASPRPSARGALAVEIARLQRIPLIVVDEVGYIPFDPAAANLIFQLVSARYERASMIVTSNKPFSGWGEIFGDEVVAAAMIDRLVHHAEILSLKGDSYRLRDKEIAARPRPAIVTEG